MADEPPSTVSGVAPLSAATSIELAVDEAGGEAWTGSGHLASEWLCACQRYSEETAIRWDGGTWTYAELGKRVDSLAGALRAEGLRTGDRVGVSLRERRFWPLAMLAVAKAGGIYVPLDLSSPIARLHAMIADADLTRVVSDEKEVAASLGCRWVSVEPGDFESQDWEPCDVFAILYTSGSTGTPKGVMLDHAGVINEVMAIGRLLDLKAGDRVLQFSSPGFDASLEEILSCLLLGATLVPRVDDAMADFTSFSADIAKREISILNLPTAFLSAWCGWMRESGVEVSARVRGAVTGGERLSAQAVDDWRSCGGGKIRLLNTYGPTETSIVATFQMIDSEWVGDGDPPIGRPLPGYRVKIERSEGEEWGELWIGGIGVGPGYWNRSEQTAAVFREVDGERWYLTGDLVKWDEEGRLVFGGRKDDQLKIRGHRIEPDEVIRVLESHSRVAMAHVGAVETGKEVLLAAWVKWIGNASDDWVGELRKYLRESLSEASVPVRWSRVDEFKLTERGKLDRRALPEPELAGVISSSPPQTATEKGLAEIWKELLEVPELVRDDDFFDLGGSSLLALRLFGKINSVFGITLPMAELLRASRLSLLAKVIDGDVRDSEVGIPKVIPLHEGGEREPLFCIHGGDGGVLFYRGLAHHLPRDVPLLTIESPELGVDGRIEVGTVSEMAGRYLKAVRKRQPKGPYLLAGFSFGGVMVYEMARLLLEAGEKVDFLGLFDTQNPAVKWRKYGMAERMKVFWDAHDGYSRMSRCAILISRAIEGVATNLRVKAEVRAATNAGMTEPYSNLRMLQVRESHGAAMDDYVPLPLDLDVILFKTEAVDDKFEVAPDYGWGALVRHLKIVDVPGEHLTMFDSEHVGDLAKQVKEHL